ncbi:hypothetical protein QCA50_012367 [Cerrena zonata]|uniref:DUF6535 domain-containing protein n=1 Tax=Cerrena zonata TaxID=2478898 RepID=A0AAW0FSW3_9APHY
MQDELQYEPSKVEPKDKQSNTGAILQGIHLVKFYLPHLLPPKLELCLFLPIAFHLSTMILSTRREKIVLAEYVIELERTGWAQLYDLVRRFDKDRVEDVKEDIDLLLVFAGLFSAVVTAFIIETYEDLQPQPDDTSAQVFLHIFAQIASLSLNGNFINSTITSFTPTLLPIPRSSILINTLWSSSLVVSSLHPSGILLKQWFHDFSRTKHMIRRNNSSFGSSVNAGWRGGRSLDHRFITSSPPPTRSSPVLYWIFPLFL